VHKHPVVGVHRRERRRPGRPVEKATTEKRLGHWHHSANDTAPAITNSYLRNETTRVLDSLHVTLSLVSQTIAGAGPLGARDEGRSSMNGSLFAELDRICGQFALALHNAELQVYAVLTLLFVLGILLFPPRNDPDQA